MGKQDKPNIVRLSKKQMKFLEVLRGVALNISAACDSCNIGRTTYYDWYNGNVRFKEEVDNLSESLIDIAESKLMNNILAGKEASVFFFLKTKGKKRGYIETVHQEVTSPFLEAMMKSCEDEE